MIVSTILGAEHARLMTTLIGISEIIMALWILSRFKSKLNAITQMVIIAAMNTLEFIFVPELLLWGKFNSIFAGKKYTKSLMFSFLKNHPFAVEAFFESSLVLTFAVPKNQLQSLIPVCLQLDTFDDQWAFIAVAMVQTKALRPKGFPEMMGNDFFLIGYRVFVRYMSKSGKRLRGLYILKSETDQKKMEFIGNIFTHYNYTTTDIHQIGHKDIREIASSKSKFRITVEKTEEVPLPEHSPFTDWKEARRFSGPLPFTFTYNQKTKEVLIVEGVRENWWPKPLKVIDYNFEFLSTLNLQDPILANAFIVENIPYYWKKGKMEKWG
eukprot:gene17785-21216_t